MAKRKIPEFLTDIEREALLAIPNRRYPTSFRNLVMMRLMLNVGLRCAEVLALKIKDVDLNTGKLMVRAGKGEKDRSLWLEETDLAMLQEWRERMPVKSYLYFTTLKGDPIDSRYVRVMVKRYGKKAGIQKDIHPHSLRHTFACDLYRDTKDLEKVRRALGHSRISTTGIYLHAVDEELEVALKNFRKKPKVPESSK